MVKRAREMELMILSELMKDSRRSDRELAKQLKMSQPTVSRIRNKLEKAGYIEEYTLIPNFTKLGYNLMALTFIARAKEYAKQDVSTLFREAQKWAIKTGFDTVMALRGMGLGYDAVILSFHESYTAFQERIKEIKQFPYIDVERIASFLVDLNDKVQYRPLTFATLADHLLTLKKTLATS